MEFLLNIQYTVYIDIWLYIFKNNVVKDYFV